MSVRPERDVVAKREGARAGTPAARSKMAAARPTFLQVVRGHGAILREVCTFLPSVEVVKKVSVLCKDMERLLRGFPVHLDQVFGPFRPQTLLSPGFGPGLQKWRIASLLLCIEDDESDCKALSTLIDNGTFSAVENITILQRNPTFSQVLPLLLNGLPNTASVTVNFLEPSIHSFSSNEALGLAEVLFAGMKCFKFFLTNYFKVASDVATARRLLIVELTKFKVDQHFVLNGLGVIFSDKELLVSNKLDISAILGIVLEHCIQGEHQAIFQAIGYFLLFLHSQESMQAALGVAVGHDPELDADAEERHVSFAAFKDEVLQRPSHPKQDSQLDFGEQLEAYLRDPSRAISLDSHFYNLLRYWDVEGNQSVVLEAVASATEEHMHPDLFLKFCTGILKSAAVYWNPAIKTGVTFALSVAIAKSTQGTPTGMLENCSDTFIALAQMDKSLATGNDDSDLIFFLSHSITPVRMYCNEQDSAIGERPQQLGEREEDSNEEEEEEEEEEEHEEADLPESRTSDEPESVLACNLETVSKIINLLCSYPPQWLHVYIEVKLGTLVSISDAVFMENQEVLQACRQLTVPPRCRVTVQEMKEMALRLIQNACNLLHRLMSLNQQTAVRKVPRHARVCLLILEIAQKYFTRFTTATRKRYLDCLGHLCITAPELFAERPQVIFESFEESATLTDYSFHIVFFEALQRMYPHLESNENKEVVFKLLHDLLKSAETGCAQFSERTCCLVLSFMSVHATTKYRVAICQSSISHVLRMNHDHSHLELGSIALRAFLRCAKILPVTIHHVSEIDVLIQSLLQLPNDRVPANVRDLMDQVRAYLRNISRVARQQSHLQ